MACLPRRFSIGERSSVETTQVSQPPPSLARCETTVFVGTEAKLSLWAAIFRDTVHNEHSLLPNELKWHEEIGLKANWY